MGDSNQTDNNGVDNWGEFNSGHIEPYPVTACVLSAAFREI